jgi:GH15 family glucan-1,4-alpha-glucosidase
MNSPSQPHANASPAVVPAISSHGVIGDLRTVALVATDGTIDWYCPQAFDSPSVFAAILDGERGGLYQIAPAVDCATRQLYLPDTNVLITRFLSPDGVGELQDFMPVTGEQRLVRRVACVRGSMRFQLQCQPRFNYGRDRHATAICPAGACFRSPSLTLTLLAAVHLEQTAAGVSSEFELNAGQTATFVLTDSNEPGARPGEIAAQRLLADTVEYWQDWISQSSYTGRWREIVNRSALTLKLLTYAPTGAIVAAPTTSLPEQLGGERNWDYRYTWIRDAALTLKPIMSLGFSDELRAFGHFLTSCLQSTPGNGSGPLQVLYGIDGRTQIPEETLDHLAGHGGSTPVRIGNDAAHQLQLDIYGEIIDAAYVLDRHTKQLPYAVWSAIASVADWLCENWDQPDEGIWETRGGRQRFTHSRLMCWVALDRAIRIAQDRGFPADLARWLSTRDQIFHRIMQRSWSESRRAFVQHEQSEVLDASVLLMPLVGFISPTDPRWLSTLDAISTELVADSLVYRYDPVVSPDGLDGAEGTFSICSFWYVEALARSGRLAEARLAFEKMLTYANHLGLYSEQVGPSGELLGNFPQAFTHLALISAAICLDGELDQMPHRPTSARTGALDTRPPAPLVSRRKSAVSGPNDDSPRAWNFVAGLGHSQA